MKKFSLFILLVIVGSIQLFAQDNDFYSTDNGDKQTKKPKGENKWVFGGDIGLAFGTNTYINVSPVALYKVTPRLLAGPGITYIYENYRPYHYQSSTYGGRVIATYALITNLNEKIGINLGDLVLYSENQLINTDKYYIDAQNMLYSDGRAWIDNLLVGGGIYQRFGSRGGGMEILVLFDVTQNPYSSYSNPILRLGFFF